MIASQQPALLRLHVGLFKKLTVNLHHLPPRLLYFPVVLVYLDLDFERLHQQAVAADHVSTGQVVQLVEGGAGVAYSAGQAPYSGFALVVTIEELRKADATGVVEVVAAASLVV